jgi:hypothetical protein
MRRGREPVARAQLNGGLNKGEGESRRDRLRLRVPSLNYQRGTIDKRMTKRKACEEKRSIG